MGTIGVRELGRNASKIVNSVERTRRPVIVTVHGRPVAVVVPVDSEGLEDYLLARGRQFIRDRVKADQELHAGETHALDDVLAELDS
ncbi:MAG TPA: type II toxin-antitoxin system Phd/YefM family antitoxin [Actinomycetes bacterium]|jgi:prevent-host-death family protein|nr:type II toxin-antitoxin system Phd/YefM family antitoxin [Actinomycetes bacterium]